MTAELLASQASLRAAGWGVGPQLPHPPRSDRQWPRLSRGVPLRASQRSHWVRRLPSTGAPRRGSWARGAEADFSRPALRCRMFATPTARDRLHPTACRCTVMGPAKGVPRGGAHGGVRRAPRSNPNPRRSSAGERRDKGPTEGCIGGEGTPQQRSGGRLEEVAQAVGGKYFSPSALGLAPQKRPPDNPNQFVHPDVPSGTPPQPLCPPPPPTSTASLCPTHHPLGQGQDGDDLTGRHGTEGAGKFPGA